MEVFKTNWDKKLIKAAKKGDLKSLKEAIKNGANIDYTEGRFSETALVLATERNNIEVVRELINQGANVNLSCKSDASVDRYYLSPLRQALCWQNTVRIEIAELLVKAGADLEKKDDHNMSNKGYILSLNENDKNRLLRAAGIDPEAIIGNEKKPKAHTKMQPSEIYERLDDNQLLQTVTSKSGVELTTVFNFLIGDITRVQTKDGVKLSEQNTKFSDLDDPSSMKPMFDKLVKLKGNPPEDILRIISARQPQSRKLEA